MEAHFQVYVVIVAESLLRQVLLLLLEEHQLTTNQLWQANYPTNYLKQTQMYKKIKIAQFPVFYITVLSLFCRVSGNI